MKKVRIVFLVMILCLLSGCGRLIDWSKCLFYQGVQFDNNQSVAKDYLRSGSIYDQLSTAAIFDALWLSDAVRTEYAHLYSFRRGKDENHMNIFLQRQLEENNHFIMFYVLSLYEIHLTEYNARWSLFLQVNGHILEPIEIKAVELPQEYKYFFGRRFTRFKAAYVVKFNAHDKITHEKLVKPGTIMHLYFRSAKRELMLSWQLDEQNVITNKVPECPKYTSPERL